MNYYLVSSRAPEFKKLGSFLDYSLSNNYWESSFKLDKHIINMLKEGDILLLSDGQYIRYYGIYKGKENNDTRLLVKKWFKLKQPIYYGDQIDLFMTGGFIVRVRDEELIKEIKNIIERKNLFLKSLSTENFMNLPNETIKFNNINIFIGENGSGKSQILKLLYSTITSNNKIFSNNENSEYERQRVIAKDLIEIFNTKKLGNLVNFNNKEAQVNLDLTEYNISFKFGSKAQKEVEKIDKINFDANLQESVFIPTKEILSFFKGFRLLYEDKHLQFDKTYYELARALERPLSKDNALGFISEKLEKILNGQIEIDNGEFYLIQNNKKIEINLIAEGLRKIAMISYLIANGSLDENSILFWDEPEANMHPKLIDDIVEFLVMLANSGMQIFIATHSPYIIESFNNHLKRDKIKGIPIDDKEIKSIEPLDYKKTTAYLLDNSDYISLINEDYGLIDDKLLQEFNELNILYDKMRDIEWEANDNLHT